jgi:SAM-dependent methyltransferase
LLARVPTRPVVVLDVGAGTGGLLIAAAGRWPQAHLVGVDASAAMLALARRRMATEHPEHDPGACTWHVADAAALPVDEASADLVTGTFLLTQVPERRALLAEMLRVVRPGGVIALLDFLAGEPSLPADDLLDEVLAGQSADRPAPHGAVPWPGDDYASLGELHDELVELGCRDVDVRPDELRHRWTPSGYLEFKERFDDPDGFSHLEAHTLVAVRSAFLGRSTGLPGSVFAIQAPLVAAVARRAS